MDQVAVGIFSDYPSDLLFLSFGVENYRFILSAGQLKLLTKSLLLDF